MQVSGTTPYINNHENPIEKYQSFSTENQQSARVAVTDVASSRSTQAQIDAYVAGSEDETTSSSSEASQTQDYVNFASDVRRANSYETFIDARETSSDVSTRPTLPVEPTPLERFQELSVEAKRSEAVSAYENNALGFIQAS